MLHSSATGRRRGVNIADLLGGVKGVRRRLQGGRLPMTVGYVERPSWCAV